MLLLALGGEIALMSPKTRRRQRVDARTGAAAAGGPGPTPDGRGGTRFVVTYEPGEVKVVTYKNGEDWATAVRRTAGDPVGLEAVADRPVIRSDGYDLAFVTVRIVDRHGATAPRADNRLRFSIEGPGEVVATDNGDPTSFEPFQSLDRAAFNGLGLAIVRARPGRTGDIRLRAESDGLAGAAVLLRSVASKRPIP